MVIGIAIMGVLLTLTVYLWYLQVFQGEEYSQMAVSNRMRLVRKPAPRGWIFDRSGAVIVDNRPGFDVEVVPEDVGNMALMEERLGKILLIGPNKVRERVKSRRSYAYLPITVESDVNMETVLAVEERQQLLPGVHIGVYPRRRYLYGGTAAHLLGSIGMISKGELEGLRVQGYVQQDLVGKTGVEKSYERFLAGESGVDAIQVDGRGYLDKVLYRNEPRPGNNVFLTIDLELQRACEAALAGQPGAVVALDPRNGEILAMASSPTYDPGVFVPPVDGEIVRALMSDEKHPLMNRAIQGAYPPGSTFKPIVSLAALENGAITGSTTFECPGYFMLGRHLYHCWYAKGHKRVDLPDGLMFSCNVFFYNVGLRTGRDDIARMACEFGMDELSGIDLPGERAGVVPTERWCKENGITSWSPGDTVVMAIGQGYLLFTPLRSALIMAAVANGGNVYQPHVVRQVVSPLGDPLYISQPRVMKQIQLEQKNLALVREGLRRVVNSRYGTGQKCKLEKVEIAGKTGTVQVGSEDNRTNHAWFVGYAPYGNPQIVLVVLLEGKESGGFFAAPAAKNIFAAYFKVKN